MQPYGDVEMVVHDTFNLAGRRFSDRLHDEYRPHVFAFPVVDFCRLYVNSEFFIL